jgi:sensor histidine kinase regulating citrate/malate metabolism
MDRKIRFAADHSMRRKLSVKLILSLTVIVVLIKAMFGYLGLRTQQQHLVDTMVLGADQLSRSITSATWQAMLDDHRTVAYDIMSKIAEKQGVDRIRMYNGEGVLTHSTRPEEIGLKLTKTSRRAIPATAWTPLAWNCPCRAGRGCPPRRTGCARSTW